MASLLLQVEKLKVGKNTISVTIASGWVVKVDWMQLILDGGAADSNIQEFSLKLENSAASENNVTVQSSVTVKQTGNVEYTTEYTLTQNATGNALDACFGTVLASETIELSLPLNSPCRAGNQPADIIIKYRNGSPAGDKKRNLYRHPKGQLW